MRLLTHPAALLLPAYRASLSSLQVWKHFGTALDPRTIVHAWLSTATVIDATNHGYKTIWSVDGIVSSTTSSPITEGALERGRNRELYACN